MPLTTEQRRANARRGMENRDKALAEALEAQAAQPAEAPSGAVLLMTQTRGEREQAQREQAAAQAVSEVDEVMMVNDPVFQHSNLEAGQGTDQQFHSLASSVTSPEASRAKKNFVEVVRPPMRTVYHNDGTAVEVFHSDVATLVEEGGVHVRCPQCRYLPQTHERAQLWAKDKYGHYMPGIHANLGENTCPGVQPLMWLPCRICGKPVYEDPPGPLAGQVTRRDAANMFDLGPKDVGNEQDRKTRCEFKRNLHEVSFHEQTALQLYGLKWETFRGRRAAA